MLVRFVNEIALDWIFFKDEQIEAPTKKARLSFFWLGVLNMLSDLAFSVLIINYLMNTNNQPRKIVDNVDESSDKLIDEPMRVSSNIRPKSSHYMEDSKAGAHLSKSQGEANPN